MRIALIATHHAEYAANLALALAAEHEVMLVLSRRNARRQLGAAALATLRERLTLRIVPHHYAPLQPYVAWVCARLVRGFAPDIVHVQEHPTRSMGMLAGMLAGRYPLVTTVHDPVPHSGNDAAAAAVFTGHNARLRAGSDRLLVHGAAMVEALAATGVERGRIRAVAFGPLAHGALDAATPHLEPDPHRLIFFGRMERYKGLDTLMAANRLWLERGVPVRLTVAGAGPELDAHREALRAPNIDLHAGRVPQEALGALIAGSAAVVLPYHDATQSGVVATAFGAGRPVICTDVGALAEAVGDAGLLVPPHDPEALAEAGRRLVEEAGLRERLTAAVATRVQQVLGWPAIAAATAGIYREIGHCVADKQHHLHSRQSRGPR